MSEFQTFAISLILVFVKYGKRRCAGNTLLGERYYF